MARLTAAHEQGQDRDEVSPLSVTAFSGCRRGRGPAARGLPPAGRSTGVSRISASVCHRHYQQDEWRQYTGSPADPPAIRTRSLFWPDRTRCFITRVDCSASINRADGGNGGNRAENDNIVI